MNSVIKSDWKINHGHQTSAEPNEQQSKISWEATATQSIERGNRENDYIANIEGRHYVLNMNQTTL